MATKSSRPIRGRNMLSSKSSMPSTGSTRSASGLYELQGDSEASLQAYESNNNSAPGEASLSQVYNRSLLTYLSTSGEDDTFARNMDEWNKMWEEETTSNEGVSLRRKKRKECTLIFNQALVLLASGKSQEASQLIAPVIGPMITEKKILEDELLNVVTRMAFLMVECILKLSGGSAAGILQLDAVCTSESIIEWLDLQKLLETDSQLKFLLPLYKARVDLAERDPLDGKLVDSKVRGVRKDLKLAMEIFNQKLRTSTDETSSLGSFSDVQSDMGGNTTASSNAGAKRERVTQPAAEVGTQEGLLQAHQQSALNLKAQSEQLKGNTKKSLVLCSEARTSLSDPTYEGIDANNLSIVYATSGRRHLALHTAAKALKAPNWGGLFRKDGTARSDNTWSLLANTALCALQARRYRSAYESMASCVQHCETYRSRPRCWLRMAEACIGMYTEKRREQVEQQHKTGFSIVMENGKPRGFLADSNGDGASARRGGSNVPLGSNEDMDYFEKYPLQQGSYCLDQVMKLIRDASKGATTATSAKVDRDCLESARCTQTYVMLELKEYKQALFLARLIIMDKATRKETGGLHHIMHKRRQATAAMYGCEACCALGDSNGALKFLTGESEDEGVFDRLAMDLAGVGTNSYLNVPAKVSNEAEENRKTRIKQAQAMVQTSASAATAAMGRLGTAKQLAMSAINLEDNAGMPLSEQSKSSARKALLYCMLREGNRDGALAVLRSSR